MARGVAAACCLALCLSAARAQEAPAMTPAPPAPSATPEAPVTPSPSTTPEAPAPGLPNTAVLTADRLHYEADAKRWIATGNVVMRYRQYTLRGDFGDYDEAAQTATLRGSVSLDTSQNVVTGGPDGVLTFHLPNRTWTFTNAATELMPQGLLEPVHITSRALSGTRERLSLRDVLLTTCSPQAPQYTIEAREVTLIPNERILARRATVTLFGHRLGTLPAVVLPIRRAAVDRPPIVPVVGQSTEEGAYIKTSINYVAGGLNNGAIRADLLQKEGVGLGVVHEYRFGSGPGAGAGEASVYGTGGLGGRNLTASLRHRQSLLGFDTSLTGDLRRHSYMYLPGTTSGNANLAMARRVGASETLLGLRYDDTRGGGFGYRNLAANMAQAYRYSGRGRARVALDYARQSAVGPAVRELTTQVDVSQGFGAADVGLAFNRITRFGAGDALVYQPVQRLPEITVQTDARRLGWTASRSAPLRLTLASGRFEANKVRADRQQVQVDVPGRTLALGAARLNLSGGFRQSIYASDMKLYSVNANARLTQPLGRRSDFALTYTVQAPRGYTPFTFDRPFPYNALLGSLRMAQVRGLELRLGTGYDFRNAITPWRDVLGFLLFQPGPGLRLATNVAVNVNGADPGQRSNIRYVNSALRLRLGRFHFDGESRFTPSTGRFGRLLGNLETPAGRGWTVRALAGVSSGQRYRRLQVVRDFGCLEGIVTAMDDRGWRTERGVRVMLRIKAFPYAESFATGMSGENLDIGAADVAYGGLAEGPLTDPTAALFNP